MFFPSILIILYTGSHGETGTIFILSNFAFMFGGYELNMRAFSLLDETPYALSLPTQMFISGGMGANAFWLGALPGSFSIFSSCMNLRTLNRTMYMQRTISRTES